MTSDEVSIDIESMGTEPGSAVIGIGACFFNTTTGEIDEGFYRAINLASCTARGLTMDASTIMWWMGQSDAARNAVRFSTYPLERALADFNAWLAERSAPDNLRPWMRGPSFDGSLLVAAYKACGIEPPWRFWNERCHRTLTARNPSVEPPEREGELHNALDDAKHQARWLIKIAQHHRSKV
jgi:hypothetical protein